MNSPINHQPTVEPSLADRIEACMVADQRRFRDRLRSLRSASEAGDRPREGRRNKGRGQSPEQLRLAIEASAQRRAARSRSVPAIGYPDDLPVASRRDEIARAIAAHQVVVVCGETGSGKTTQLPKICLELGRGVGGLIGHTQPRRIAARTVAARIAQELSTPLGGVVGYKVRFGDRTSPQTLVKVMTDGMLLAETQSDPQLEQYDTLIIDEAHERSLNIDFLIGYVRRLLPRRPDLKVIITSATIDPARFADHFAADGGPPVPILEVSGRTYPVEVRYRPLTGAETPEPDEDEPSIQDSILKAVDELCAIEPGTGPRDILIFLSGEREIRETAENLRKRRSTLGKSGAEHLEVLPLYSRLSAEEQNRVFAPPGRPGVRRIVLATNVAETSLTVPGIRYVIDPGFARISRYSPRNKVQRLPIEPVSQSSADQRAGRCGRVADGVCIRLYSAEEYQERPRFTDPEILRTNLASVILQMKALHLGRIENFPFLDPPDDRAVRDGLDTLEELSAVSHRGDLTPLGAELAKLPVDPRIGRMVLAAQDEGCLDEILIIAAALSVQDPRERPFDARDEADKAHGLFRSAPASAASDPSPGDAGEQAQDGDSETPSSADQSDFLIFVNIWNAYHEQSRRLSTNKLRKWCKEHFLSPARMREWHDMRRQLRELAGALDRRPAKPTRPQPGPGGSASYAAIHRALLAGLLSNVATLTDRYEYTGARGIKASLFPGSVLFRSQPRWIVAAELVRTTRLYARTAARIQPSWIEKVGAHMVKRTYSEPYWNERMAQVWASERVTFMGLELIPHRRVHFGTIDPAAAREIFIQRALVEREYWSNAPFARHNRKLIEEAHSLQARYRRHDLMADAQALFAFFDSQIPDNVYSGRAFELWLRKARQDNPRVLHMSRDDLLPFGAAVGAPEDYPDSITFGAARLPLEYRYEPGHPADGVTLIVPAGAVSIVREERCDWLVPGLLREKVIAMMRTLPKSVRRLLTPAPVFADRALDRMKFAQGDLRASLAEALSALAGEIIAPDQFQTDDLPEYLRMNFRVVEDTTPGATVVAEGRDLRHLRAALRSTITSQVDELEESESQWRRDGLLTWDFDELPVSIKVKRSGLTIPGFPAIIDASVTPLSGVPADVPGVSLRLLDSRERASAWTRLGLRRLFAIAVREEALYLIRDSSLFAKLALLYGPIGATREMEDGLLLLVAEKCFLAQSAAITSRRQFELRLDAGWHRLGEAASEVVAMLFEILTARHNLDLRLDQTAPAAFQPAVSEVRRHMADLFRQGFLATVPLDRLLHFPRYLRAAQLRIEKLNTRGVARDEEMAGQVRQVWQAWTARKERQAAEPTPDPALDDFRWLIEEWRVSLFAQELGVAEPVSIQRLEKRWAELRS